MAGKFAISEEALDREEVPPSCEGSYVCKGVADLTGRRAACEGGLLARRSATALRP
jgi:hypothetical protein